MSALAIHPVPPAPAPGVIDRSKWADVREVAVILGGHPDHWRRLCRDSLRHFGRAVEGVAEDGGNRRWWISRDYDIRLAPGALGDAHRIPDLTPYPEAKVAEAFKRVACVQAFRELRARESRPERVWLAGLLVTLSAEHGIDVSERSLRRWHAKYRSPCDVVGLIDTRGGNTKGECDPAAWQHFCGLYLQQNRRTLRFCWRQTKADALEQGWTWCSYAQCVRRARRDLSPAVRAKARKPGEYLSRFSPHLRMDPETWAPGELWLGDHSCLDLWCDDDGELIRPWLTAWMDWRTRKIVGWVLTASPNSETIRAAFAAAITDPANKGGPDGVYIDNGKDYAAYSFIGATKHRRRTLRAEQAEERKVLGKHYLDHAQTQGLYGLLNIGVTFALPYNARAKGRLERWFGYCLHDDFDRIWDSYAGNSPANRPERLAAVIRLFTHRDDRTTQARRSKWQKALAGGGSKIPTFAEIRDALAAHIANYNACAEHTKYRDDEQLEGLSPDEAYQEARGRTFADPSVLTHFLLTWREPVTVGRNGVSIRPLGKSLTYHHQSLVALKGTGQKVHVGYHQHDLSKVYVFLGDGADRRLYCVATANDPGLAASKAGRQHLAEALSRQRAADRAAKALAKDPGARVLPAASLAAQAAHAERLKRRAEAGKPAPGPRPGPGMRLVQTPLDGQSNAVAAELRAAAGAEGVAPRPSLTSKLQAAARRPLPGASPARFARPAMPSLSRLTRGGA